MTSDGSLHFTCYRCAARVAGFNSAHVRSTEFVLVALLFTCRNLEASERCYDNRKESPAFRTSAPDLLEAHPSSSIAATSSVTCEQHSHRCFQLISRYRRTDTRRWITAAFLGKISKRKGGKIDSRFEGSAP